MSLNVEHLVITPSTIRIVASRHIFKNRNSAVFKAGGIWASYDFLLRDEHGLYDLIREYVEVGRAQLIEDSGIDTKALFVNRPQGAPRKHEPGRFTPESFSHLIRTLSERHLAWNERLQTGIRGVKPFGNHLIRDILCTGTLKATGSEAYAAASIHDSIEVVQRYYAFWPLFERMAAAQAAALAARGQSWSD